MQIHRLCGFTYVMALAFMTPPGEGLESDHSAVNAIARSVNLVFMLPLGRALSLVRPDGGCA